MKDLILASLYPVLLLRGELVRLVYLPLLIIYYNNSGYGIFLCFCCFVEYSEIFLRKIKRISFDKCEDVHDIARFVELWHCAYDILFCVLYIISSMYWYGPPPFFFVCDISRYLSSATDDVLFVLCLCRYGYEILYLLRPRWFSTRSTDRNVSTLWLIFGCILFSAMFGIWLKCLEILMIIHFLEATKKGARVFVLVDKEATGTRLMKIHQIMSITFIIYVVVGVIRVFSTNEGDSFCDFTVLAIYAMSTLAFGIERFVVS